MYLGTIQGAEEAQEDCQDGMVANVSAGRPESVHTYMYICVQDSGHGVIISVLFLDFSSMYQ